jgi:AcrR family transcriptional regulator
MARSEGGAARSRNVGTERRKRRPRMSAEERREQILEAAQRVFIRSGLSGSRTRELAQEAGVNEATLFAHFKSKEELFDAAVVEPLERSMRANLETAQSYRAATSVEDQIRLHKEAQRRFLVALQKIYPLLVTALFSDSERGKAFYRKHILPWFRALNDTQRETFAGRPRKKDLPPEMVSMIGVGAYMAIVMDHYFRGEELDLDEAVDAVAGVCNSGFFEP